MALTTCGECSKQISTTAKSCPHCGAAGGGAAPTPEQVAANRRGCMWSTGISAAILLAFFAYCSADTARAPATSSAAASYEVGTTPERWNQVAAIVAASGGGIRVEPFDASAPRTMRIIVPGRLDAYDARKLAVTARERLGDDAIVYVKDDTGKNVAKASPWGVE